MPGRNAPEAHRAFIDPIAQALGLLGQLKVTSSYKGGKSPDVGRTEVWTVNAGDGVAFGSRLFKAAMWFGFLNDPNIKGGPWRCTTTAYRYTLYEADGTELLGWHWHPDGPSPMKDPHIHVGSSALVAGGLVTNKTHIATGRVSIEAVVRTLAIDMGLAKTTELQTQYLDTTEHLFKVHSSWH